MARPVTLTCRYHCAACGRHFRSLEAFDQHRAGDHAERRYCEDPRHLGRLEAAGLGECRLTTTGETDPSVVIYRLRGSVEGAHARFRVSSPPVVP